MECSRMICDKIYSTQPPINMEPTVRGVLVWTIFLSEVPGPGRQVPC